LVWVKLPILQNSITKIYVDDSGNKDLSDIDSTMIFGDDFRNETALDTSKWTVTQNVGSTISFPGLLKIETLAASDIYTFNPNQPVTDNTVWYIKYYFDYTNSDHCRVRMKINASFDIIEPADYKQLFFNGYISGKYLDNNTDYLIENIYKNSNTVYLNIYSNNQLFYASNVYTSSNNTPSISLGENSIYFDGKSKLFYIKNTIFSQSSNISSYNPDSYIETPVVELTDI